MQKKKFWAESSWVVFFIIFFIFLKVCVVGVYLIPSASMQPTLIVGDRVVTNQLAFGLNLPFFHHTLFQWGTPKRGDIILFSFENNNDIYIKRVIGLPGDLVSFRKGRVFIDSSPLATQTASAGKAEVLPDTHLFLEQNAPDLLHGNHLIQLDTEPSRTFFETRRFLVPPGMVFVLGDNRDHSGDSRVYGFVPFNRIYGRTNHVLFSTTGSGWLPHFRKGRLFLRLNAES